ncbi:MAG: hypothetical protein HYR66_06460 [Sphingobacteriales bacterium]|nr:hypothetical protein [Sphingobacteriales bacterium]MBI3720260.1 hypothetical protein [Sphingobacteriales bacterium]
MSNMDDMNNELKKFVQQNRDEFDDMPLPAGLWNKIEDKIQPKKPARRSLSTGGKSLVIEMRWVKMAAAAVVIAAVGLITFKMINTNSGKSTEEVVAKKADQPKTNDTAVKEEPATAKQTPTESTETQQQQSTSLASNNIRKNENTEADDEMGALVHFTKIIHSKQKQLITIKKYSPELYEHFVADYTKLDKSYNDLKNEMKTNPNKEVLLEKMIANLQLQIDLLNEQLKVVREINKTKKDKANEISKTI